MTEQDALLAAIRENPEEDTPRLAYADWLDENAASDADRARAEFIRVQIERYHLPAEDDDANAAERRVPLEFREEELCRDGSSYQAWATPWNPPLPPSNPEGVKYSPFAPGPFVRGFRNYALATPEGFVAAGNTLFDAYPVHGLYAGISDPPLSAEVAHQFLASPWLRRARRIEMNFHGPLAERVFACEHLAGLESLVLRYGRFAEPGTPAAGPPALGRLRSLSLVPWSPDDPRRADRVAELLAWDGLEEFHVQLRGTDRALEVIAQQHRFQNLTRLRLGLWGVEIGHTAPGLRALTASPSWPRLRSLCLHGEGLGDEEAEVLASAPPNPELRQLHLSPHYFTTRGLTALAGSPILRSVADLSLGCGNGLGDDGIAILTRSPHLMNLAVLDLAVARFGPKGVKALGHAPWVGGLVRLNLRDNAIKKAGVEILADPTRFPRLRRLDLQRSVRTADLKAKLTARYGNGVRFVF